MPLISVSNAVLSNHPISQYKMGATTVQEKSTEFNQLADAKTLEEAGKINIKDCDGKEVEFKSLYSGKPDGERQLIVFIRHFMCGVSRSPHPYHFSRTLSALAYVILESI